MKTFSELGIKPDLKQFVGDKIPINDIVNQDVIVLDYAIGPSKFSGKNCLKIQIKYNDEHRVVFTASKGLENVLYKVKEESFPFTTKIKKSNNLLYFT